MMIRRGLGEKAISPFFIRVKGIKMMSYYLVATLERIAYNLMQ